MRIVFAHNVYNRFKTLEYTVRTEKLMFPDSHSVIAYNVESPNEILKFDKVELIKFNGVTHKIGCTNGCITAIKGALAYEPDVIVFSHDDVMLNPTQHAIASFMENINHIVSGIYDVICRKPLPTTAFGDKYYLMECFFISKKAAEETFGTLDEYRREEDISRDARGSISPEVFMYETLNNKNLKILEKTYIHTLDNYNNTLSDLMGFIHKNAGDRGWID